VNAFARASGRDIPYDIVARRPGDIAECYADTRQSEALLGWVAERELGAMVRDHWRWQQANPDGYGGGEVAPPPAQTSWPGHQPPMQPLSCATPLAVSGLG